MIDMDRVTAFLGFDEDEDEEQATKRARCESSARDFMRTSLIAAISSSRYAYSRADSSSNENDMRPNKACLRLLRLSPAAYNKNSGSDSDDEDLMEMISDVGHNVLDVAGMVPMIGEVADLANAGWYAAEGEYGDAAISAAAAVPLFGNAATAGKLGSRFAKSGDDVVDEVLDDLRDTKNSTNFWAVAVPSAAIGAVFGAVSYQRYWFLAARVVKVITRQPFLWRAKS